MANDAANPNGPLGRAGSARTAAVLGLSLATFFVIAAISMAGEWVLQDPTDEQLFRIVDEAVAPVAGARVEIWTSASEPGAADAAKVMAIARGSLPRPPDPVEPALVLTSDHDGRCRGALPRGAARVVVSTADGRTSGWVSLRGLQPAGESTIVVYRRFRVEGRVLAADGSGTAEARVDLVLDESRPDLGRSFVARPTEPVWTEADGTFATWLDPDAVFTLRATTAELRTEQARVWTVPGGRESVTLHALGTASLALDLVDADGEAVLGGLAYAVRTTADPRDRFPERFVSEPTAERGRYEIRLPGPGTYLVRATGPYLASNEPIPVSVPDERGSARVQIELPDPVSIRGRLVMPGGVPLAEAVLLAEVDWAQMPWQTDSLENATTWARRVRTDYDGTFEVMQLHPDFVYDLQCEREDGSGTFTIAHGVRGADAEQTFVVDADELAGAVLRIDIATAGGAPRPDAIRYDLWERRDDRWSCRHAAVEAEVEGSTARIEGLEAGVTYALVVRASGFATAVYGSWTCRRFADYLGIELSEPGSVTVRVVDARGAPVEGAVVHVRTGPALPFLGPPPRARTDVAGSATIGGLPAGAATVTASRGSVTSAPRRIAVAGGTETQTEVRIR